MAEAHGGRDTSTISLLERAGLDCAGAVQLFDGEQLPAREASFEAISEVAIGRRLRAANLGQPVADRGERWSVAGQQGKLALHQSRRWWCGDMTGCAPRSLRLNGGLQPSHRQP